MNRSAEIAFTCILYVGMFVIGVLLLACVLTWTSPVVMMSTLERVWSNW